MSLAILITFIVGYLAIALEHPLKMNKAAIALVTGVLCWILFILSTAEKEPVIETLLEHLGDLSQILFFLMGAMAIVELIDAHDGFEIITKRIKTKSKQKLIWIICFITFFLSAVLDNLTTTIVMMSLIRKVIADRQDRLIFTGAIVVSANAGGAWSPIGDVTTTMLWIGGQITAFNITVSLIIPSLVCLVVPLLVLHFVMKGTIQPPDVTYGTGGATPSKPVDRKIVFFSGIGVLLLVPVFKTVTHLPPFMGMLFGLGILWIITEIIHSEKDEEDRKKYTVAFVLRKIDTASILFFLGILLAIAALQTAGQLQQAAAWMDTNLQDKNVIILSIGLLSSIVDNVPLVAAAMGMYSLEQYPPDHYFWEFMAYCTGTGGSVLIIGSAAGVAAMGIEKVEFFWYLKRIGWLALLGYFAGALAYMVQTWLFG
ncbi:MAG: sodium:proton antiporter NhaD, partial [Flavisolibacter sp.]|nr:sodium:proton antiporter NhaD [Flavisolibacter sp.]MBD0352105.1 sodium:proton antiporter NhaD [Flavisolibacter sp.]